MIKTVNMTPPPRVRMGNLEPGDCFQRDGSKDIYVVLRFPVSVGKGTSGVENNNAFNMTNVTHHVILPLEQVRCVKVEIHYHPEA